MSENHHCLESSETTQRDRLLWRVIGCLAAATCLTFGLAITTALWQQAGGDLAPVSLAQDAPR